MRALKLNVRPRVERYPVQIVFTDVARVASSTCSASLVSVTEGWDVLAGEVEKLAESIVEIPCAAWSTEQHIQWLKLKPGAVVHQMTRGYTGDRSEDKDVLYVNPPEGCKVRVERDVLVISCSSDT